MLSLKKYNNNQTSLFIELKGLNQSFNDLVNNPKEDYINKEFFKDLNNLHQDKLKYNFTNSILQIDSIYIANFVLTSNLDASLIKLIIDTIFNNTNLNILDDVEITLEINAVDYLSKNNHYSKYPNSNVNNFFKELKNIGINRISLKFENIKEYNDLYTHKYITYEENLIKLISNHIKNINVDYIFDIVPINYLYNILEKSSNGKLPLTHLSIYEIGNQDNIFDISFCQKLIEFNNILSKKNINFISDSVNHYYKPGYKCKYLSNILNQRNHIGIGNNAVSLFNNIRYYQGICKNNKKKHFNSKSYLETMDKLEFIKDNIFVKSSKYTPIYMSDIIRQLLIYDNYNYSKYLKLNSNFNNGKSINLFKEVINYLLQIFNLENTNLEQFNLKLNMLERQSFIQKYSNSKLKISLSKIILDNTKIKNKKYKEQFIKIIANKNIYIPLENYYLKHFKDTNNSENKINKN